MSKSPKQPTNVVPINAALPPPVPYTGFHDTPELAAYFEKRGARQFAPRFAAVSVDIEGTGYDHIKTVIRFDTDGRCNFEGNKLALNGHLIEPTPEEKLAIAAEFSGLIFPHSVEKDVKLERKNGRLNYPDIRRQEGLPEWVRTTKFEDIDVFYTSSLKCVMVQAKRYKEDGMKQYIQFTPYSDGTWQMGYPDDGLPFYGMEHYNGQKNIAIHEGANSAKYAHRITNDDASENDELRETFGMAGELFGYLHLGGMGGAGNPGKVNVDIINELFPEQVILCSDNDDIGRSYMEYIGRQIKAPTLLLDWRLDYKGRFPETYDFANPMPASCYLTDAEGKRHYVGPKLDDITRDITFLTYLSIPPATPANPNPPVVEHIHDYAMDKCVYIDEADLYIIEGERGNAGRLAKPFDAMISNRVVGKSSTAKLYAKYGGKRARASMVLPGYPYGVITVEGDTVFNLWRPSPIRPLHIDAKPWHDVCEFIFPQEHDRKLFLKTLYTLVARPKVKLKFAMLLYSPVLGLGKSALSENVFMKLIGEHNTNFATIDDINSQNNGYLIGASLILVDEIYDSNNKFKTAEKLKSFITQTRISAVDKYKAAQKIINSSFFLCCSNHIGSISLGSKDRRWLIPFVRETPLNDEEKEAWAKQLDYFLDVWLPNGGLQAIAWEAHNYNDYWATGDEAPKTNRKAEFVYEGLSDQAKVLKQLVEWVFNSPQPYVLNSFALRDELAMQFSGREGSDKYKGIMPVGEIVSAIVNFGLPKYHKTISVEDYKTWYLVNYPARIKMEELCAKGFASHRGEAKAMKMLTATISMMREARAKDEGSVDRETWETAPLSQEKGPEQPL